MRPPSPELRDQSVNARRASCGLVCLPWSEATEAVLVLPRTVPWGAEDAMKTVVYTRYGPPEVLRRTDVEMSAPRENDVLVKVHAVSLNRSDWEGLRGKPAYSRI